MPKEYKIERNPWNYAGESGWEFEREEQYLNAMSERGWNLVTVCQTTLPDGLGGYDHEWFFYFAREIEINAKLREIQLKEGKTDESEPRSAAGGVPEEGV